MTKILQETHNRRISWYDEEALELIAKFKQQALTDTESAES